MKLHVILCCCLWAKCGLWAPDLLPLKICFFSSHVFSNLPTHGGTRLGVPLEARVDCELPGAAMQIFGVSRGEMN